MTLADEVRAEVRTALHETRTSQAELARRLGMSSKHVSRVLTGNAAMTLGLADAMMGALGGVMTVRTTKIKAIERKAVAP